MHSTYGYPSVNHLINHPSALPSLPSSSPFYSQYNGGSLPSTPNPSLAHIRLDDESSFGFFDPPPSATPHQHPSSVGGIPPPSQLYHTPSLGSTFSFDAPPTSYPLTAGGGGGGGGSLASPVLDLPLYSDGFPSSAAPYNSPVPLSTFSSSLADATQPSYPLSTASVPSYPPALNSPPSAHYAYPSSHKRSRSDAIPSSVAAIKTEDGILSLQNFASPTNAAPAYPSFPVQSVPAVPAYTSPVSTGRRSADVPPRNHSSASLSSSSSGSSQPDQPMQPEPPAKRSHANPNHAAAGGTSSNGNNQRPTLRTAEERSAWRKKKHREMDAWRRKKETAVVERFAALSGQQEEKVEEKRDRVTTLEVACERYASLIDHVKALEEELRREKDRVASMAQEIGMLRMAERGVAWENADDDTEAADTDYETWKRARQARKASEQQLIPTGASTNNDNSPHSPTSPTPSSPPSDSTNATTATASAGSRRVLLDHLIHYHHSHVLYSSLFLHSSQMMLIISTSTARFLDISESFLSRTGFQRSDIIGKIFWGPYSVLSTLQPMPPPPRVDFSDRPPVLTRCRWRRSSAASPSTSSKSPETASSSTWVHPTHTHTTHPTHSSHLSPSPSIPPHLSPLSLSSPPLQSAWRRPWPTRLRRILLAEVPSLAIEKVVIFQNTSIVQDEVLAHRLGLIPIRADPTRFRYLHEDDGVPNELNTLVFTLDVQCTRTANATDTATAEEKYAHSLVTTADLVWHPQGRQVVQFAGAERVRPYYDDIVIAKMRPGQSIEAELHVEKGIGAQHAKWSPVATASYRLMPEVRVVKEVRGEKARELVRKCPMHVFDIEDVGGGMGGGGEEKRKEREDRRGGGGGGAGGGEVRAVVARPRNCTMCRECVRGDDWSERVELRRVRDHFIFSVETTGAYTPAGVVKEAMKILKGKAERIRKEMEKREQKEAEMEEGDEGEQEEGGSG